MIPFLYCLILNFEDFLVLRIDDWGLVGCSCSYSVAFDRYSRVVALNVACFHGVCFTALLSWPIVLLLLILDSKCYWLVYMYYMYVQSRVPDICSILGFKCVLVRF